MFVFLRADLTLAHAVSTFVSVQASPRKTVAATRACSGRTDILSAAVHCMTFPLRAIDQCDTEARVPKQAAPFLVDKVENGGRTNAAAPSDPA